MKMKLAVLEYAFRVFFQEARKNRERFAPQRLAWHLAERLA